MIFLASVVSFYTVSLPASKLAGNLFITGAGGANSQEKL